MEMRAVALQAHMVTRSRMSMEVRDVALRGPAGSHSGHSQW